MPHHPVLPKRHSRIASTSALIGWLLVLLSAVGAAHAQTTTTVEYIHTDALGSSVAVTNEAGQVIERTQWEPYGAATRERIKILMDACTAEYIWNFIATHVIGNGHGKSDHLGDTVFSSEIDLPLDIEDMMHQYFNSKDREKAVQIALATARKYQMASFKPNEHMLLIAYLAQEGKIDLKEASILAQIDRSNFGLMSNDAKNLVITAECITEERELALFDTDSDQLLGKELAQYINNHGKNLLGLVAIQQTRQT